MKIGRLLIIGIVSCLLFSYAYNGEKSENIEIGINGRDDEFFHMIRTSCLAEKKQNKNNIEINVRVGHYEYFANDWNSNKFGTNLGYGSFSVLRDIRNIDGTVINRSYYIIEDFLSSNYDFKRFDDSDVNKYSVNFNYSFVDKVDKMDIATMEIGAIVYSIGIVDNNEVIIENIGCVVYKSTLYFKIQQEACNFYIYEREIF